VPLVRPTLTATDCKVTRFDVFGSDLGINLLTFDREQGSVSELTIVSEGGVFARGSKGAGDLLVHNHGDGTLGTSRRLVETIA
jgi:hypothetical protein